MFHFEKAKAMLLNVYSTSHTVFMIVNFNHKMFLVQATGQGNEGWNGKLNLRETS